MQPVDRGEQLMLLAASLVVLGAPVVVYGSMARRLAGEDVEVHDLDVEVSDADAMADALARLGAERVTARDSFEQYTTAFGLLDVVYERSGIQFDSISVARIAGVDVQYAG